MTLKQILKQCRKSLQPVDYSWEEINGFMNQGIYNLSCYCGDPQCHKKFKSPKGVRIHQAKVHGWTKKAEKEFVERTVGVMQEAVKDNKCKMGHDYGFTKGVDILIGKKRRRKCRVCGYELETQKAVKK